MYSNPHSIAGAATLFQNQILIEEFRRLNPWATDKRTLIAALQSQRFKVGPYKEQHGGSSYGLMIYRHDSLLDESGRQTRNCSGKKYASIVATTADENPCPRLKRKIKSSDLLTHPVSIVIYGLLVAGLEALVIYYNQTGEDTAFERFMDSESFGVSFLFTAVGVGIDLYWTHLDESEQTHVSFP